jgi:hypothetical protein
LSSVSILTIRLPKRSRIAFLPDPIRFPAEPQDADVAFIYGVTESSKKKEKEV